MNPITFHTDNITVQYEDNVVIGQLNLQIPTKKITAIIGENGSGKSTILKTLARILDPVSGAVYLDGKQVHQQPTKTIAKQLAILAQQPTAPDGITVRELISFGRFPYQKGFHYLGKEDQIVIDKALTRTNLLALQHKTINQLSGGQRQRAWIAMALAQDTPYLLLDEPTTYLDIAHQLEIFSLLKELNQQENKTIIMVVHDLNHAARFANHLIAIQAGKIYAEGQPIEILTKELLAAVFRVKAEIMIDPQTRVPTYIPYEVIEKATE